MTDGTFAFALCAIMLVKLSLAVKVWHSFQVLCTSRVGRNSVDEMAQCLLRPTLCASATMSCSIKLMKLITDLLLLNKISLRVRPKFKALKLLTNVSKAGLPQPVDESVF
jgi:hypothetical protein